LNIGQNIAPKFFKIGTDDDQIRSATKVLQKILCHEWEGDIKSNNLESGRMSLFKELLNTTDFIPEHYLPLSKNIEWK